MYYLMEIKELTDSSQIQKCDEWYYKQGQCPKCTWK